MSWLDGFLSAIKTVQAAGLSLVQRETINFVSGATVVDDPVNLRTNVTIASLATPTGTGYVHVTGGVVDGAAANVNLATQVTGTLALGSLAHGTPGQLLATNASNTAPEWATCSGDIIASTSTPGQMSVVEITGAGDSCLVKCSEVLFYRGTVPVIKQEQSASDPGVDMTISAQQGTAGEAGGELILSSGQGGTPGTDVAGGIALDLRESIGGEASSILAVLVDGSSILDISQPAHGEVLAHAYGDLTVEGDAVAITTVNDVTVTSAQITITEDDFATNSAVAPLMAITSARAQGTSATGGSLEVSAGGATNTGGIGGNLLVAAGTGIATGGDITLAIGGGTAKGKLKITNATTDASVGGVGTYLEIYVDGTVYYVPLHIA